MSQPLLKNEEKFAQAVDRVAATPTGKFLLERAQKLFQVNSNQELVQIVKFGEVSKTDAILTRHLDQRTGNEEHRREVAIYIKGNQSIEGVALDFSHELVHASASPAWNPYDPALTPAKYVMASLESSGGEVDAIETECRVALEMKTLNSLSDEFVDNRCGRYLLSGRVVRNKVMADIYRVGDQKSKLVKEMGLEVELFPLLSIEQPVLFSSTGRAPYPIALLSEYKDLTKSACDNSRRRINNVLSRSPASDGSSIIVQRANRFLQSRCNALIERN